MASEFRFGRRPDRDHPKRCPEARLIASTLDLELATQKGPGALFTDEAYTLLSKRFYDPAADEQIAAAVELQKALLRRMGKERLKEELAELRTRYVVAIGGTAPTPPQPLPTETHHEQMLAECDNLWDQLRLVYAVSHERDSQIDQIRRLGLIALLALFVVLALFATLAPPRAQIGAPSRPLANLAASALMSIDIPKFGVGSAVDAPAQPSATPLEPAPIRDKAAEASGASDNAIPTVAEIYPPLAMSKAAKRNSLLNYLLVVVAASSGAVVSILQRIHVAATLNPLAADPVRQISALRLGWSGLLAAALMGPASALVLLLAFASEAVKFTSLTPTFVRCDAMASSGFIFLDHCAAASTRGDAAMILVWSFVAGFAERLVPDVLDRFVNAVRTRGGTG